MGAAELVCLRMVSKANQRAAGRCWGEQQQLFGCSGGRRRHRRQGEPADPRAQLHEPQPLHRSQQLEHLHGRQGAGTARSARQMCLMAGRRGASGCQQVPAAAVIASIALEAHQRAAGTRHPRPGPTSGRSSLSISAACESSIIASTVASPLCSFQ